MSCFESEIESPVCRVFGEAAYQGGLVSSDDAEKRLSRISHVGSAERDSAGTRRELLVRRVLKQKRLL